MESDIINLHLKHDSEKYHFPDTGKMIRNSCSIIMQRVPFVLNLKFH